MIVRKILQIINELREYGYPVCTDEVCDFLQALTIIPSTEWNLKDLLYITLVKDDIQAKMLETILFYKSSELPVGNIVGDREFTSSEYGQPEAFKEKLFQYIVLGDMNSLKRIISKSLDYISEKNLNLSYEEFNKKIKVFLEWKITENKLLKSEDPQLIINLESAQEIFENEVKKFWYNKLSIENKKDFIKENMLVNKDLGSLDTKEQMVIEQHIQKLTRYLAMKKSRRWIRAKSGLFDFKKTFSTSIRHNFLPYHLYYKKPKITKTNLYVLCDISGSVSPYALFLLQLVQGIYNVFKNVKAFVFVDQVAEISHLLAQARMSKELITELFNSQASISGFSNYALVGQQICNLLPDRHYFHSILIVIGDCRTNYQPAGIQYWRSLCSKFNKTIFLNPEPIERWNQDDSQVKDFMPLFHYFFECRNINQLEKIISFLL